MELDEKRVVLAARYDRAVYLARETITRHVDNLGTMAKSLAATKAITVWREIVTQIEGISSLGQHFKSKEKWPDSRTGGLLDFGKNVVEPLGRLGMTTELMDTTREFLVSKKVLLTDPSDADMIVDDLDDLEEKVVAPGTSAEKGEDPDSQDLDVEHVPESAGGQVPGNEVDPY